MSDAIQKISSPYGFVYLTTNHINGKRYIGQRKYSTGHEYYLGSGKALKNAIKKYGYKNFEREIIAVAYSRKELNEIEIQAINQHNAISSPDYYNIASGGANGNPFAGKSDDEMARIKANMSRPGEANPNYGKPMSQAQKIKLSLSRKQGGRFKGVNGSTYGLKMSDETKSKIGFLAAERMKIKENNPMFGKHHTAEAKQKIAEKTSQSVLCISTTEVFSSIKEASEKCHVDRSNISRCCRGLLKYAGKVNGTRRMWEYCNQ